MSTLPHQIGSTRTPSPGSRDLVPADVPATRWRALGQSVQPPPVPTGLDYLWHAAEGRLRRLGWRPRVHAYLRRAQRILQIGQEQFADADVDTLAARASLMREAILLGRAGPAQIDEALAVASHAARACLGFTPYREQLAGALAMLDGCIGELATGEGKTLVAVLAAVVAGWEGRGCHVITVNDYLAARDAEWMGPIYQLCGLTVACVQGESTPDQRRRAYAADVTYATNREVTADFLRDRLMLGRDRSLTGALLSRYKNVDAARAGAAGPSGADRMVMRELAWAIVDEADSVLIDEAVTPLIISGPSPNAEQTEAYVEAARLAAQLEPGRHYRVDHRWREVHIHRRGSDRLDALCENLGGVWAGRRRREELVNQALVARELFHRDKQYVVQDEKVVIVDTFTGRLMPDRTWRDGLHQAIEAREGLEIQPPKQTLARMSFQRFFRLYRRLAGMTGTAWEARHELWQTYRLPVMPIPTHRPIRRRSLDHGLFRDAQQRWSAVVAEVQAMHRNGRPVLVGTRSVEASEQVSAALEAAGLDHQVLNARRHDEEAAIIAEAGQPGRVTVATNMAGRGTDIKLGQNVADRGGLHVIMTEAHESGRVDRQLFGRAGRQGDPGSVSTFLTTEDELLKRYGSGLSGLTLRLLAGPRGGTLKLAHRIALARVQRRAEAAAHRQRRNVLRSDDWLAENLAFAGPEH